MSPAGRPGGQHFVQAMRTSGHLRLAGADYIIDGYFTRDRSWAGIREETARQLPPLTWMVGIFNDNLAFHTVAFDDPARNPEWLDAYPGLTSASNMTWGYIRQGGTTVPLESAAKLTTRENDGLAPRFIEMTVSDINGRTHDIRGTVQARMPWQTWQNMNV